MDGSIKKSFQYLDRESTQEISTEEIKMFITFFVVVIRVFNKRCVIQTFYLILIKMIIVLNVIVLIIVIVYIVKYNILIAPYRIFEYFNVYSILSIIYVTNIYQHLSYQMIF